MPQELGRMIGPERLVPADDPFTVPVPYRDGVLLGYPDVAEQRRLLMHVGQGVVRVALLAEAHEDGFTVPFQIIDYTDSPDPRPGEENPRHVFSWTVDAITFRLHPRQDGLWLVDDGVPLTTDNSEAVRRFGEQVSDYGVLAQQKRRAS
ncbi:MAG TPA: hypothetical protein VLI54_00835 [Bacillota bacterium]|nr:hypothetical protein [Bacillota bacterium]